MLPASLLRNTLWNLSGALLPIPAALVCIPLLVSGLGMERFGMLGVAWMVLGYFGLFDFGMSQGTTRFIAASASKGDHAGMLSLALGSLLLHGALGSVAALLFALLVPWLADVLFSTSPALNRETRYALYWLAATVPLIVLTAALRGMLEGLQRFDIVNRIRIAGGIVNYVGPVIGLYFDPSLPSVIVAIFLGRVGVFAAYSAACVGALPKARSRLRVEYRSLLSLAAFGGWLSVSSFVNPLLIATDRFVIATAISVVAVAYYVMPYEIVTKAWLISASMMGAMFPALSVLAAREPGSLRSVCRAAETYLLFFAAPVITLLLGSADWLLECWLGTEFGQHSTAVARWLAVGILVNIVAQVPLTALHAIGRADITAKIALAQLPVYAMAAWYCGVRFDITGVAAVWTARALIDALMLFSIAHAILPNDGKERAVMAVRIRRALIVASFLAASWIVGVTWRDALPERAVVLALLLVTLVGWEWRRLLTPENRLELRALWNRLSATRAT